MYIVKEMPRIIEKTCKLFELSLCCKLRMDQVHEGFAPVVETTCKAI
jgi:hypothetical protein